MVSRRKFIRSASGLFVPALVGLTRKSLCQPLALPPFGAPQASSGGLIIPSTQLWWQMKEGSGSVVSDATGNGFTGTAAASPTWTTCPVGGALSFNGSSQYASTSATFPQYTTFSISVWINPGASPQSSFTRIVYTDYQNYFYLGTDTGGTKFQLIVADASIGSYIWPTAFVVGTWYNVIATFQASGATGTATLYVNGSNGSLGTATFNVPSAGRAVFIANGGGGPLFNGKIGDLRLFNAVLTAGQIAGLQTQL